MDNATLRWKKAQEAERTFWLNIAKDAKEIEKMVEEKRQIYLFLRKKVLYLNKEEKILEIGVNPLGLGLIRFLEDKFKSWKIGIDPLEKIGSPFYKDLLSSSNYFHIQSRGEELPFRDNCFGLVIIDNVIDHSDNPKELLQETNRVLRDNGILFIRVNIFSYMGKLKWELYEKIIHKHTFNIICHPHTFTEAKMKYYLNQNKFELLSIFPEDKSISVGKIKEIIGRSRKLCFVAKKRAPLKKSIFMKIAFVTSIGIHKQGGTQKSTAYLIEDLAKDHSIFAFTPYIRGIDTSKIKFFKVPIITRPAILRYLTFFVENTIIFAIMKLIKRKFDIIATTGADCLFANVIIAHYCVAEYLRLVKEGSVLWPERNLRQKLLNLSYHLYYSITHKTERWLYSHNSKKLIIAVSEGLKRDLIRHYRCLPEQVIVIPNAVDEEMFIGPQEKNIFREEIHRRHLILPNEVVLLFVAAGDWKRKGLPLVIKALSYLQDGVKLIIVGKDEVGSYLAIAKENKLQDKIIFAGSSLEVRKYYAAGDIFVFPSYFEAFSLVSLEAAASGLPLITTKVNGTEELIKDGYNGFFVKHDPQDIGEKINFLLKDRELMRKMGENARKSAMKFRRQEITKRTAEIFEKVIKLSRNDL